MKIVYVGNRDNSFWAETVARKKGMEFSTVSESLKLERQKDLLSKIKADYVVIDMSQYESCDDSFAQTLREISRKNPATFIIYAGSEYAKSSMEILGLRAKGFSYFIHSYMPADMQSELTRIVDNRYGGKPAYIYGNPEPEKKEYKPNIVDEPVIEEKPGPYVTEEQTIPEEYTSVKAENEAKTEALPAQKAAEKMAERVDEQIAKTSKEPERQIYSPEFEIPEVKPSYEQVSERVSEEIDASLKIAENISTSAPKSPAYEAEPVKEPSYEKAADISESGFENPAPSPAYSRPAPAPVYEKPEPEPSESMMAEMKAMFEQMKNMQMAMATMQTELNQSKERERNLIEQVRAKEEYEQKMNGVVEEVPEPVEEKITYRTVAVTGSQSRIGVTTQAMQIVKYLSEKCGKRTAYVEICDNGFISGVRKWFECIDHEEYGKVTYNGVDMYSMATPLDEIFAREYDYFVLDFGTYNNPEFNRNLFLDCDLRFMVMGTAVNELEPTYAVLSNNVYKTEANFIFTFVSEDERPMILEMMKECSSKTVFSDYVPNMFELVNANTYKIFFEDETASNSKKKGIFKK